MRGMDGVDEERDEGGQGSAFGITIPGKAPQGMKIFMVDGCIYFLVFTGKS